MEFRVDARRQQRPRCARCGFDFEEGYSWHAFGEVIVLCSDCTADVESSVNSYGEGPDGSNRRFLQKLREIISEPAAGRRQLGV
jgi:transposase-like protein